MLGLSMCLQPFTIDPYLASYPAIETDFDVTTALIQFSMTGVTLGFAFGQIFAGTLSDSIGRRRPMLILSALHLTGSLLCFVTPNIDMFFFSRLLQGVGGAGAAVLMGAIVRDLYTGAPMLKMMARVSLISGLAPILAPLIGSQLVTVLPWRDIFLFLAFYGAVVWFCTYRFLIETLHRDNRRSTGVKLVLQRFKAVLGDRIYVGILIYSVLQIVALFGYLNTVSFLYQGIYGLTPALFGLVFASNSVMLYLGTQLGARLGKKYPAQWILIINGILFALAGYGLIFAGIAVAPLFVVEALVMLMLFNFGSTSTLTGALTLAQHPNEAGTAASLIGVLNFTFTSLLSGFYPMLGTNSSFGIGCLIAGCLTLGVLALFFVMKPKTVPALQQ